MSDEPKTGFLWIGTGLPKRLQGTRLADLAGRDAPQELAQVTDWLAGLPRQQAVNDALLPVNPDAYGRGLLLTGLPGRGKTATAAALACEVRRRDAKSVYFTRWATHVQRMRDLHTHFASDARDSDAVSRDLHAADRVEDAYLVVLDDVGGERVTDTGYGAEMLETTLRNRYDDGKPTIITSNLTSEQWTARYSGPLRSFIAQACRIVVFTGRNYRSA